MFIRVFVLFIIFYSYAFFRYHIGAKIPFDDWFFILNKSLAWFSFTLIGFSILSKSWFKKRNLKRKKIAILGFTFALIHLNSTVFLFSEQHFPTFYSVNHQFTNISIFVICIGILAMICFIIALLSSLNLIPKSFLKFGYIGFILILFHPLLIGYEKWMIVSKWPLYLPPITLISFCIGLIFIYLRQKRKGLN